MGANLLLFPGWTSRPLLFLPFPSPSLFVQENLFHRKFHIHNQLFSSISPILTSPLTGSVLTPRPLLLCPAHLCLPHPSSAPPPVQLFAALTLRIHTQLSGSLLRLPPPEPCCSVNCGAQARSWPQKSSSWNFPAGSNHPGRVGSPRARSHSPRNRNVGWEPGSSIFREPPPPMTPAAAFGTHGHSAAWKGSD